MTVRGARCVARYGKGALRKLRRSLTVLALALLALGTLPRLEAPAVAAVRSDGHILAREWTDPEPAKAGAIEIQPAADPTAAVAPTVSVTSGVVDAGQRFDFLGVHWRVAPGHQAHLLVEARWSADGASWSDWQLIVENEDMADESVNERYAGPFAVGDQRYAQYRVVATDGDLAAARAVSFTFMDVSNRNASPLTRLLNDVRGAFEDLRNGWSAAAAVNAVPVRSRKDWAADESLMTWWPQYVAVKKVVVHHTVTTNKYTDSPAEIRAIYFFHAVTRGWGDIGYNFIVDRFGTVWQGRQGGDDVVGGHAFGWNEGSMGVATLGDFTATTPTPAMLSAFAHLIAMKFAQRGIAPFGSDTFTHKEEDPANNKIPVVSNPPNIVGHRECSYLVGIQGAQTACPGDGLYNQMQSLKEAIQSNITAGYSFLPYLTTNQPHVANVGQGLAVGVTVKNAGTNALSGASVVYRILDPTAGYALVAQGQPVSLDGDLFPGQSRPIVATLLVPAASHRYLVRWDLQTPGGLLSQTASAPVRDEWLAAVDWDVTWVSDDTPTTLSAGQTVSVNVTFQNTGTRAWPAQNVRLSYHWVSDVTQRTVIWNGTRALLPSDVQPGQQVTVPIQVTAPAYPTRYRVQYDIVWEGSFWFSDKGSDLREHVVNVPFDYQAAYQAPPTLTLPLNTATSVPITVTNTGSSTWPSTGGLIVDLGTHWYTPSGTLVTWDGVRTPLPRDLGPGQTVTMNAKVQTPATAGTYIVKWDLSFEGVSWFGDKGVAPAVTTATVKTPTYGALYEPGPIGAVAASITKTVPMALTNRSDFAWSSPAFNLAYHLFDAAGRVVEWDGLRSALPSVVQPGQTVAVQASLALPSRGGSYLVKWDLVQEGVTWFSDKGVPPGVQSVTIGTLSYGASYDNAEAPAQVATAMRWNVLVGVTNRSNFTFSSATNVYLAYHWLDANGRAVVWNGARSPLNLPAGQSGGVWVAVYGPPQPGSYRLAFDLVQEGVAWFSDKGVPMVSSAATAVVPSYGAVYAEPGASAGASGAVISVPVTVRNTGSRTWSAAQVFMAYHLYRGGSLVVWDGLRTALPSDVAPGQSVTVQASVRLPSTAAEYEVRFDLVQEGVTWFSGAGVPTSSSPLVAQ